MGNLCGCARAPNEDDIDVGEWDDHFPAMSRTELRVKYGFVFCYRI